jgi:hypothetical protein
VVSVPSLPDGSARPNGDDDAGGGLDLQPRDALLALDERRQRAQSGSELCPGHAATPRALRCFGLPPCDDARHPGHVTYRRLELPPLPTLVPGGSPQAVMFGRPSTIR